MKKEIFAIWFVTVYLTAYAIIAYLEVSVSLVFLLFALSPFLVVWMVMSVLKSKTPRSKTLKAEEEWGYNDTDKTELGIF